MTNAVEGLDGVTHRTEQYLIHFPYNLKMLLLYQNSHRTRLTEIIHVKHLIKL